MSEEKEIKELKCKFHTGEIACNCTNVLTTFGTNSTCTDNKDCPYKESIIYSECLLDIYNYKMSKRDINKRIENCFGSIGKLRRLVNKKLKIVKEK